MTVGRRTIAWLALPLLLTAVAVLHAESDSPSYTPKWSQAVSVTLTPAVRDLVTITPTEEEAEKIEASEEAREKNAQNLVRVKRVLDSADKGPFVDPAIENYKLPQGIEVVTNPIQNFDTIDMDTGEALFGGRFAPPDTNAAVGPNHVVVTTNGGIRIYDKTGVPAAPAFRMSALLVGVPNAGDDDGDPVVLYDTLADRWILSQFNLSVTNSSTHQHVAISTTGDPTGTYYAYDFLMATNRPADYPHMGVWPDGYYMSTNDFSLPVFSNPFQGASLYVFERAKMLTGDPTALNIHFSTNNQHGGLLPSNLQGPTAPPAGTPNLFFEFDADEFGAAFDLIRQFDFHADFAVPANSTLTQGPDIATALFDARNPSGRADIAQPAPGEGLDSIADRLMHALNFRMLPGGVQSYVLNFTVNVSGVNPTNAASYQAGIRWMELRRNAGTGAITINQEATYAPGSGSGTGRDLWMAAVAQDGEGNIALAANASNVTVALNPTAIYTGRLAGDPGNTLPQGEVDAFSAVPRGVQTATSNRWGDYSALFVDPTDDCTFWGSFEYVDPPTASFDWNTRAFSFKVNPTCASTQVGRIEGTVTNCVTAAPVVGGSVTVSGGYQRTTDGAGAYAVNPVAVGTYSVSATATNYNVATTNGVNVTNGGTATVNLCLTGVAALASAGGTLVQENCGGSPNGVIDSGETVDVSLCLQNVGVNNTVNAVATLQATGGVTEPSGAQSYGVLVAGGAAVCRTYSFKAATACGDVLTATLDTQDGVNSLGSKTFNFSVGTENVALSENFDSVATPALPAGWATAFTNGDGDCTPGGALCGFGSNYLTVNSSSDTAPNSAFHNDPSCVTDASLDSPVAAITSASAQVSFRHRHNLESTFDGGVLEIAIGGGGFVDILAAGGSFVSGPYTGPISNNFLSPIAGRQAWSGNSTTYITTKVNLPAAANGQNVQLRFRTATDCSVAATGWNVDTVKVTNGFSCCSSTNVIFIERHESGNADRWSHVVP